MVRPSVSAAVSRFLLVVALSGVLPVAHAASPFGNRPAEIDLTNTYQPPRVYVASVDAVQPDEQSLKGTLHLYNAEEELIADLSYRVEIYEAASLETDNPVLYGYLEGAEVAPLLSKEKRDVAFDLRLPVLPKGEYAVRFQLMQGEGRLLGWETYQLSSSADLAQVYVQATGIELPEFDHQIVEPLTGPNVDANGEFLVHALASNPLDQDITVTPVLRMYAFDPARGKEEILTFEPVTIRAHAEQTITLSVRSPVRPGVIKAYLTLQKDEEVISPMAPFRWVVRGLSGDIVAVRVQSLGNEAGDTADIRVDYVGPADAETTATGSMMLTLADDRGVLGRLKVIDVQLKDALQSSLAHIHLQRAPSGNAVLGVVLNGPNGESLSSAKHDLDLTPEQRDTLLGTTQTPANYAADVALLLLVLIGYLVLAHGRTMLGAFIENPEMLRRPVASMLVLSLFAMNLPTVWAQAVPEEQSWPYMFFSQEFLDNQTLLPDEDIGEYVPAAQNIGLQDATATGIQVVTARSASIGTDLPDQPVIEIFVNRPIHDAPAGTYQCNGTVPLEYRLTYAVCYNQPGQVRVIGRVDTNGGKHTNITGTAQSTWLKVHDRTINYPLGKSQCTGAIDTRHKFCFTGSSFNGSITMPALRAGAQNTTLQLAAKLHTSFGNPRLPNDVISPTDYHIYVTNIVNIWMNCAVPAVCGNGTVETGEQCDDGNQLNTDGCTNLCRTAICGDGFVRGGQCPQPPVDPVLGPQCSDNIDNDGDGGIDALVNATAGGGNFAIEAAGSKYTKTFAATITCRNGNAGAVTIGTGDPYVILTMLSNAITQRNLPYTKPTQPLIRSDGGTGGGNRWNDNGTQHLPTLQAACSILGYDTYVSSTCLDTERSWRYPFGKCYFHSPEDNHVFRFSGSSTLPACSDGRDNDNDGQIDFPADTGCVSRNDNNERAHDPQCTDPSDNSEADIVCNPEQCDDGNTNNDDACTNQCTLPSADVTISKSGPSSINRGANITYTLTARNNGPNAAQNVTVTDAIPTGLSYQDGASDSRCNQSGNNVVCALGTMTNGQQTTIAVVFQSSATTTCGTLTNTASISTITAETNVSNNQASFQSQIICTAVCGNGTVEAGEQCDDGNQTNTDACTNVCRNAVCGDGIVRTGAEECDDGNTVSGDGCSAQCFPEQADLSIAKTGPASVNRGSTISYTLVASNAGPATATNVTVSDPVPAGLTFNAAASTPGCVLNGANVLCNNFSLTAGQNKTFTIVFNVPATLACNSSIQNRASVSASSTDTNPANNQSQTVTSTVQCPAVCGNGTVETGEQCDDGNTNNADGCTNVCRNAVCGDGIVRTGTEQCDDGNVVSGDGCSAQCSIEPAPADLTITKTGPATIARGTTILYTLTARNAGPGTATNVVVSDPIPTGLTFNAAQSPGCVQNGVNILCNNFSLTNGQSRVFTVAFTVPATQACGSSIQNRATVSSSSTDSNPANNQSQTVASTVQCPAACGNGQVETGEQCDDGNTVNTDACTNLCRNAVCGDGIVRTGTEQCDDGNVVSGDGCSAQCSIEPAPADLSITKTGPAGVVNGTTILYTLTATNAGPGTATNVVIADPVPAGLTFNQAQSTAGCVLNGANVLCNNFSLTSGQSKSFTVAFNLSPVSVCNSTIQNRASVSASSTDPNPANNQSQTVTSTVLCPASCGNGTVETGEQCDDGNTVNTDACTNVCRNAVCGDGIVRSGFEQCDDANVVSGDGCSAQCTLETTDVGIVKTGPASATRGSTLVYTLTVRNLGTAAAQNVTVIDPVPAGTQFVSAVGTSVTCAVADDIISCNLSTLAAATTRTITVTLTLPTAYKIGECPATVVNTATVSTTSNDTNGSNAQSSFTTSVTCPVTPQCRDGIDNDGDGAIDSVDFSCANPDDNDETNPKAQCQDGLDNDADGKIDFPMDPGCTSKQDNDETNAPAPQCSDGIDNDGDGAIDLNDFSCSGPTDNDETNPKAQCQDGLDNDNDGKIDFPQDPGCTSKQDNDEFNASTPQCRDGIDNDADGKIDFPADSGCQNPDDDSEASGPFCTENVSNTTGPLAYSLVNVIPGGPVYLPWATQGSYVETSPTTGTITGTLVDRSNPNRGFTITMQLSGRVNPGDVDYPPVNSPHTLPGFNASDWFYYTNFTGTLTGYGEFAGAVVTMTPRFAAVQIGEGAHNINPTSFGLGGWFYTQIVSQPTAGVVFTAGGQGDIHFNLKDNCTPPADLSITKTGPATIAKGTTILYTLTAHNAGPGTATNVVIADPVPAGLTFNQAQSSVGCVLNGANVLCNNFSLTSGQSKSFIVAFNVPATQACDSSIQNRASVSASSTDSNPANNQSQMVTTIVQCIASCGNGTVETGEQCDDANQSNDDACTNLCRTAVCGDGIVRTGIEQCDDGNTVNTDACTNQCTLPVTPKADVQIAKVGPATLVRGNIITYVLTVKNNGPDTAQGIVVTDAVPAGLTFIDPSSDARCNLQGSSVVCPVGSLPSTQSTTISLSFQTAATLACGQLTNTATVSAETQDLVPANNQHSAITPVDCTGATLTIAKSDNRTTVAPGETLTYTITVVNTSAVNATGITVTDILPTGLTFVTASTGGVHSAGTVTWSNMTVPANQTVNLTVQATVGQTVANGTVLTNTANAGTLIATDQTTVSIPTPTFTVSKTDNKTSALPGETLNYVITVVNTSQVNATGITIQDTLPTNVTFVSASTGSAIVGGTVQWINQTFAAGQSKTFTVNVTVNQSVTAGTILTNTATAGTVTAQDTTTVNTAGQPTFTVTKTDNKTTAVPGDTLSYVITVLNTSQVNATNVTLTDTLPANVTFVSASDNGIRNGLTVTWSGMTIPAAGSVTRTIAVTVNQGVSDGTVITNTASVGAASGTDSTTVASGQASLTIDLTDSKDPVAPCDPFIYTVRVTNVSGVQASNRTVTQTLGGDTTFQSASAGGTHTSGTVTWTNQTIPANGSITLTTSVQTSCTADDGDILYSTAITDSVSDQETTRVKEEDGDDEEDLSISVRDDRDPVCTEEHVRYTLTVRNDGNSRVTTDITGFLDEDTTFVDASDDGDEEGDDRVRWDDVTIDADDTVTLDVTVRIRSGAHDGQNLEFRARAGNEEDTELTRVDDVRCDGRDPSSGNANIAVDKRADRQEAQPGSMVSYTLTIRNTGSEAAHNLVIEDVFSAGTFTVEDAGGGSINGNGITWTVPTLGANASRVITYRVRLSAAMRHGQTVSNTVNVRGANSTTATDTEQVRIIQHLPQTGLGGFLHAGTTSSVLRKRAPATPSTDVPLVFWLQFMAAGLAAGGYAGRRLFFPI